MKVHDNCPRPGRIWSVEVPSGVGRRRLCRIIASIPGVRVMQFPGLLSRLRDEPFCRFELDGRRFIVEATWPVGEHFEITPDPRGCAPELLLVREALLAS